jgi:hypothetical protein
MIHPTTYEKIIDGYVFSEHSPSNQIFWFEWRPKVSLRIKKLHSNFVFRQNGRNSFKKWSNTRSLDSTTIFGWTNAKIGRNVSKPVEYHPNRRKQTSHVSNFNQIERNSTKKGDRILTARIRPFLSEFRPFWRKSKLLCSFWWIPVAIIWKVDHKLVRTRKFGSMVQKSTKNWPLEWLPDQKNQFLVNFWIMEPTSGSWSFDPSSIWSRLLSNP